MAEWQNPETIIRWIIFSIVFFLVLFSFIVLLIRVYYKKVISSKLEESRIKLEHQKNLLEVSINTQEKERKRIAADLHDDVIGKLTAIKMMEELRPEKSEETIELLSESIQTARRISHDLSPPLLSFSALSTLIENAIAPLQSQLKVVPIFDVRTVDTFDEEFKVQFIRILQEIITNIVKYADASEVEIHYRQSNLFTCLQVIDNGKGFNINKNRTGLGLKNIETRVSYLNGIYRLTSEINKGTKSIFVFKTNE
ncbi:sensor histidine kinase [Flammeovirga sp. MY04]|uniref:sensor histidine kinase n=1 Tax=Flammeovirga sp. MY04 TaxID=1191459 RepID=UPI000826D49B|nr:ATP-binding protein [Flammeovirga sp. MY04]ANQ51515.2 sensor histidine kinase [Flammeovirga sp. MY04]